MLGFFLLDLLRDCCLQTSAQSLTSWTRTWVIVATSPYGWLKELDGSRPAHFPLPEQSFIPPNPHTPAFFIPEYFSLWTRVRLSLTLSTVGSYCASACFVFWTLSAIAGLLPYLDNSYPFIYIILPVLNVQMCPVAHRVTQSFSTSRF